MGLGSNGAQTNIIYAVSFKFGSTAPKVPPVVEDSKKQQSLSENKSIIQSTKRTGNGTRQIA